MPTIRLRHASFDDLLRHPDAISFPASAPPAPPIALRGLSIADTADDLVILPDAIGVDGTGIAWRDMWLAAAIHNMPGNWRDVSWLDGSYDAADDAITFDAARLQPKRTIDAPVLLVDSMVGASNFGHFVHDTLPYAHVLRRARRLVPDLRFGLGPLKFANQRRLFHVVFEQPPERRVPLRNARIRRLVLARRQSMMAGAAAWQMPFAGLRHARDQAYRGWLTDAAPAGPRRVFLHRFQDIEERRAKGLLYGRDFANTEALLLALLGAGFVAIDPGAMPIEEIAALLAGAECVASLHGAGLANIIFCRPGTRVFEIRSHAGNWRSLEALAAVLGHRFAPLVQPKPQADTPPMLDIPAILAAVQPNG